MLIRIPTPKYKKVIIGGNLNAFLCSYQENAPLIINKLSPPHRFETFNSLNALELWNRLFFILSMTGQNLLSDKTRKIRIKENEMDEVTKHDMMAMYYDKPNKEVILSMHFLNTLMENEVF